MQATAKEIKWVYDLIHSQMFYKGKTLEEAIKIVFSKFDGTEPADLKEKVLKYAKSRT
jgi:hypothetical protein